MRKIPIKSRETREAYAEGYLIPPDEKARKGAGNGLKCGTHTQEKSILKITKNEKSA